MKSAEENEDQLIMKAGRVLKTKPADSSGNLHPPDEALACYCDGILPVQDIGQMESHLAGCSDCRRLLLVLDKAKKETVPADTRMPIRVLERLGQMLSKVPSPLQTFKLLVRVLRENLEVLDTDGEVIPAPALAMAFRGGAHPLTEKGVAVRKRFEGFDVRVEVVKTSQECCRVTIHPLESGKETYLPRVRVTLSAGGATLESLISREGPIIFDRVGPEAYTVDFQKGPNRMGQVCLELQTHW